MMRLRSVLMIGFVLLCSSAFSQGTENGDLEKQKSLLVSSKGEVNEILDHMVSRLGRQKDLWFDDGEFRRSIDVLLLEVTWTPRDYDAWTSLGWMYGNIEAYDREIITFTKFRDLFPNEPEAHYPLGEFYYRRRNFVACIAILEPTITWEKKPHANTYRLLAHSFDKLGRFDQALAVWDQHLRLEPEDAAAKVNRQKVADKLGGT